MGINLAILGAFYFIGSVYYRICVLQVCVYYRITEILQCIAVLYYSLIYYSL